MSEFEITMIDGPVHPPEWYMVGKLSAGRKKLYEEACAVALMVNEPAPCLCNICYGKGRSLFGVRRCAPCGGYGYGYTGPATLRYIKDQFNDR